MSTDHTKMSIEQLCEYHRERAKQIKEDFDEKMKNLDELDDIINTKIKQVSEINNMISDAIANDDTKTIIKLLDELRIIFSVGSIKK